MIEGALRLLFSRTCATDVCEKNTPPEINSHWSISFQSAKSVAGEQFLLLACRARACAKILLFTDTDIECG